MPLLWNFAQDTLIIGSVSKDRAYLIPDANAKKKRRGFARNKLKKYIHICKVEPISFAWMQFSLQGRNKIEKK